MSLENRRRVLTYEWNHRVPVLLIRPGSVIYDVRTYSHSKDIVSVREKVCADCIDAHLTKLETPVGRYGHVRTFSLLRKVCTVHLNLIGQTSRRRFTSRETQRRVRRLETEKERSANTELAKARKDVPGNDDVPLEIRVSERHGYDVPTDGQI